MKLTIKVMPNDPRDLVEDWGRYDFEYVPAAGQRVVLYRDEDFVTLKVIAIEHHPIEWPVAHPNEPDWRKTSRTYIYARRCGPLE